MKRILNNSKQIRYVLSVVLLLILNSCITTNKNEAITKKVWETVKAHNKAWTVSENINEQLKYVHGDILFVSPPFNKILSGKDKYKEGYENWMMHAEVNHFKEIDPVIKIYNKGNLALVSYHIDMSFKYDDKKLSNWKGIDMMTLTKENGKWLIISDMYAEEIKNN